jgi:methionyl-tRNA formyltransferase
MKLIFMGTPQFAAYVLQQLIHSTHEIMAVVTVPDKPAGRGLKPKMSDVKRLALEHQIAVLQPSSLKDETFIQQLKSYQADLFMVVAFKKLPKEVWQIPPKGTVNIHASLLPQYRGAAPINWVLINGEKQTGVTIFYIDEQIDSGKIISFKEVEIPPKCNAAMLHDTLMHEGALLLLKTLPDIEKNNVELIDQTAFSIPAEKIMTAPKITPELCKIDWTQKVEKTAQLIRGLSPYPAAYTKLIHTLTQKTLQIKIFDVDVIEGRHEAKPGTLLSDQKTYLYFICDGGLIQVNECQPEGKKRMNIRDFLNGFKHIDEWMWYEN